MINKKILIIEDEENFQKTLSETLRKDGFEVFSALDGEQGIKMVKKELPNLVLLDLILPKKDGFEVLREMKADAILGKIPVIVLTNLEGGQDIERVLSLGARTYLVKANYSLQEVVGKIEEIFKSL